jgi:hypothetical protein
MVKFSVAKAERIINYILLKKRARGNGKTQNRKAAATRHQGIVLRSISEAPMIQAILLRFRHHRRRMRLLVVNGE